MIGMVAAAGRKGSRSVYFAAGYTRGNPITLKPAAYLNIEFEPQAVQNLCARDCWS